MMPLSSHRRIGFAHALSVCGAALALACAPAGAAPAPNAPGPTPGASPEASSAAAGSSPASTTTPGGATPAASAPQATAPAPSPSAEPAPPCVDGEVVMGACICPDKGKTPDATGHCIYPPCPKTLIGGTAFRDEATGQCLECRAGTKPTKDGKCAR